jgi:hypothetical protein
LLTGIQNGSMSAANADLGRGGVQADLLGRLADRGRDEVVVAVLRPAAREAHLPEW